MKKISIIPLSLAASLFLSNSTSIALDEREYFIDSLNSDTTANSPVFAFDFRSQSPVIIREIAIYPRSDRLAQTPIGSDVAYSDEGINWTIARSNTTTSWTAGWRTFSAPP